MKKLIIVVLLTILLPGCIEFAKEPQLSDFYGTWFPCDETTSVPAYRFEPDGNLLKATKIQGEIYYTYYCHWSLDQHVLVLCGTRLNFRFDNDKLYLYDFNHGNTETCYKKVD